MYKNLIPQGSVVSFTTTSLALTFTSGDNVSTLLAFVITAFIFLTVVLVAAFFNSSFSCGLF